MCIHYLAPKREQDTLAMNSQTSPTLTYVLWMICKFATSSAMHSRVYQYSALHTLKRERVSSLLGGCSFTGLCFSWFQWVCVKFFLKANTAKFEVNFARGAWLILTSVLGISSRFRSRVSVFSSGREFVHTIVQVGVRKSCVATNYVRITSKF